MLEKEERNAEDELIPLMQLAGGKRTFTVAITLSEPLPGVAHHPSTPLNPMPKQPQDQGKQSEDKVINERAKVEAQERIRDYYKNGAKQHHQIAALKGWVEWKIGSHYLYYAEKEVDVKSVKLVPSLQHYWYVVVLQFLIVRFIGVVFLEVRTASLIIPPEFFDRGCAIRYDVALNAKSKRSPVGDKSLPVGTFLGGGNGPDGKSIYVFVADEQRELHHIPIYQMYPLTTGQTVHLKKQSELSELVDLATKSQNPMRKPSLYSQNPGADRDEPSHLHTCEVNRNEFANLVEKVADILCFLTRRLPS